MGSISIKILKRKSGNMGSISFKSTRNENLVIWDQYLSKNMKSKFGNMGSISIPAFPALSLHTPPTLSLSRPPSYTKASACVLLWKRDIWSINIASIFRPPNHCIHWLERTQNRHEQEQNYKISRIDKNRHE